MRPWVPSLILRIVPRCLLQCVQIDVYILYVRCRCRCVMPRSYVGPPWPPQITDYDYILTLCPSDLAWEFLRRNPDYQRDYRLSRRGWHRLRRLRSGHLFSRMRRHTPRAIAWGLHPFRGSGSAGSQSVRLLADRFRRSTPRGGLRPPNCRRVSRSGFVSSPMRSKSHSRARPRGKPDTL